MAASGHARQHRGRCGSDYGKPGAAARPSSTLQSTRSLDLDRGGLIFRSLASTALEAQDLRGLLKLDAASVLLRQEACESRLKQLKAPLILHIASHGFFLSDQQLSEQMTRRRGARALPMPMSENPLLRSRLALAGVNERSSGEDDGVLTALEVTQLDLHGTELVVLSACDSGVGEIQNGEDRAAAGTSWCPPPAASAQLERRQLHL